MPQNFHYLNEMRMDELRDPSQYIFFLPVGISEGHGRHLPIGTDTIQAEYVTAKVAERLSYISVIAPTLHYGHCRETSPLPGTLSISFDTLQRVTYDILDHACAQGFERLVLISGHAGRTHMAALKLACERSVDEHNVSILLLSDYDFAYDFKGDLVPETDGHGGEIETARVLDIRGDLVREDRPSAAVEYPRFQVMKDPAAYFSEGVIGDPGPATKEEGKRINEYVIDSIVELLEATWQP